MSIIRRLILATALVLALVSPSDAVMFSNQGSPPQPGYLLLIQCGNITLYQGGSLQCFAC